MYSLSLICIIILQVQVLTWRYPVIQSKSNLMVIKDKILIIILKAQLVTLYSY